VSDVKIFDDEVAFGAAAAHAPAALAGETKLALVVAVDAGAERMRIGKEMERLLGEIGKAEAQLGNERFVQRAPPKVVEEMRQRVAGFRQALRQLEDQQGRLAQSA
jgi:valyl-tRNA synthetase